MNRLCLAVATLLAAAACGPQSADERAPSPPSAGRSVPDPAQRPPGTTASDSLAATTPDTTGGGRPDERVDSVAHPFDTDPVVARRPNAPPATLAAIRVAAHEGYDRLVFEFAESAPGHVVRIGQGTPASCGSGMEKPVRGAAWLDAEFVPAQSHDENGSLTAALPALPDGLAVVTDLARTCDFEGHVAFAIGTARTPQFRVFSLQRPARLVIDVRRGPGS